MMDADQPTVVERVDVRLIRGLRQIAMLYSSWLVNQPIFAFILGGVLIMALTPIGDGYGIADLFWHESGWTQAAAGASIAFLALLMWYLSFASDPLVRGAPVDGDASGDRATSPSEHANVLRRHLRNMFAPVGAALAVVAPLRAAADPSFHGARVPIGCLIYTCFELGLIAWVIERRVRRIPVKRWQIGLIVILAFPLIATVEVGWLVRREHWLPLGAIVAWLLVDALLWLLSRTKSVRQWQAVHGFILAVLIVIAIHILGIARPTAGIVTAVMALCVVLAELALLAFLTQRRPFVRIAAFSGFVLWVGWANGGDPYKLTYPGLETYYDQAQAGGADEKVPVHSAAPGDPVASLVVAPNAPPDFAAAFTKARQGFDRALSSDYDGAIAALREALRLDPRRPDDPGFLADARKFAGSRPANVTRNDRLIFEKDGVSLDPAKPDFRALLASSLAIRALNLDRKSPQVADWSEAAALRPEHDEYRHKLANAYVMRALKSWIFDVTATRADLSRAIELDPAGSHSLPGLRAPILYMVGDLEGAYSDVQSALADQKARSPDTPARIDGYRGQILARHGEERLKAGDYPQAVADLELALQSTDRFKDRWKRLHWVAKQMADAKDDLVKTLDKLVAERGEDPLVRWARGVVRARQHNLGGAIEDYTEAIRHSLADPSSLERRAACYSLLGRDREASADHDRATLHRDRETALLTEWAADTLNQWREKQPELALSREPQAIGPSGMVDDRQALEAWLKRARDPLRVVQPKPVLVVLATSGGGIAAAAWTVGCLKYLEVMGSDCFPQRIRMIFGASGGMVGAGMYVGTLQSAREDLATERIKRLRELFNSVTTDSLTPVARQMLLGDFVSVLFSRRPGNDRGRALERAWDDHTHMTARPLSDLAKGEREGWRPSLVISPMLVEDANFLLISNLALDHIGRAEEFFELYPKATSTFQLGTALRMNAAFPFVTPGVALPASPTGKLSRRVVDAGYLDNYGVFLACSWIERHKSWLLSHTSGVFLLQLRAYPIEPAPGHGGVVQRIAAGFQFMTTPPEGVTTARLRVMIDRNEEQIARLRTWFNDKESEEFFHTDILECDDPPPLGWSLTAGNRAKVDTGSMSPKKAKDFDRVRNWVDNREEKGSTRTGFEVD